MGAANFLKENQAGGPIFNTYEYGGYLLWSLWPEQRTFIDGRALNESVYDDYRKILYSQGGPAEQSRPAHTELLERYGVQIVVTNAFEFVTGAAYPDCAGPGTQFRDRLAACLPRRAGFGLRS